MFSYNPETRKQLEQHLEQLRVPKDDGEEKKVLFDKGAFFKKIDKDQQKTSHRRATSAMSGVAQNKALIAPLGSETGEWVEGDEQEPMERIGFVAAKGRNFSYKEIYPSCIAYHAESKKIALSLVDKENIVSNYSL